MLRRAKGEPGKDAGSAHIGTEIWVRPRTTHGEALQPPEREMMFGAEH